MKKIGLIIGAIIVLVVILVLTLVIEIIEIIVGAVLFILAAGIFVYYFKKGKDKLN